MRCARRPAARGRGGVQLSRSRQLLHHGSRPPLLPVPGEDWRRSRPPAAAACLTPPHPHTSPHPLPASVQGMLTCSGVRAPGLRESPATLQTLAHVLPRSLQARVRRAAGPGKAGMTPGATVFPSSVSFLLLSPSLHSARGQIPSTPKLQTSLENS